MCGKEGENKRNSSYFVSPNTLSCKEMSSKIPKWVSSVMENLCVLDGPPEAAVLVLLTAAHKSGCFCYSSSQGNEWTCVKIL